MRTGIRRHLLICKIAVMVAAAVLTTVNYARADPSQCDKAEDALAETNSPAVAEPLIVFLRQCAAATAAPVLSAPPTVVERVLIPWGVVPDKLAPPKFTNPSVGDVLMIGGLSPKIAATEFFNPITKKFVKTGFTGGPAAFTPIEFSADAQILIAGGFNLGVPASGSLPAKEQKLYLDANPSTSALLYDFTDGMLAATEGESLNTSRAFYTATLISGCGCALDGEVLIAGGFDSTGQPDNTAELYDPTSQTFTLLGNKMTDHRAMHTATLLNDGTVLIVGGIDRVAGVNMFNFEVDAVATNSAEIFDPSTQTFTAIPMKNLMPFGAAGHTATLLNSGKLLIAGGFEITPSELEPLGFSLNQAELYNPTTQTFTATGNLTDDRVFHTATLLPNGTVLLTGGFTTGVSWTVDTTTDVASVVFESGSFSRNTAEIFDPTTGTFACVKGTKNSACVASMAQARAGQSATLLPTGALAGEVLIAGGWSKTAIQASAELYNPAPTKTSTNGSFKATGAMSTPHALHGALLLQ
jgi:hypothetical protein